MIGARLSALALAVYVCATAFGSDANERKFIREGMGEGEVLFKIGKPDHEAFIRVVKGEPEERRTQIRSAAPTSVRCAHGPEDAVPPASARGPDDDSQHAAAGVQRPGHGPGAGPQSLDGHAREAAQYADGLAVRVTHSPGDLREPARGGPPSSQARLQRRGLGHGSHAPGLEVVAAADGGPERDLAFIVDERLDVLHRGVQRCGSNSSSDAQHIGRSTLSGTASSTRRAHRVRARRRSVVAGDATNSALKLRRLHRCSALSYGRQASASRCFCLRSSHRWQITIRQLQPKRTHNS